MGTYESLKGVANVLKEAGKIEEYQKILDLINVLFQKNEEIENLKEENKGLKDMLKTSEAYIFRNNSYWNKENNDGPYCSRCFDKHKNLIRLIPPSIRDNYANCPECKNYVNFTGKENPIYTHHLGEEDYT